MAPKVPKLCAELLGVGDDFTSHYDAAYDKAFYFFGNYLIHLNLQISNIYILLPIIELVRNQVCLSTLKLSIGNEMHESIALTNTLIFIRDRIYFLIDHEKLDRSFLIRSLISEITKTLKDWSYGKLRLLEESNSAVDSIKRAEIWDVRNYDLVAFTYSAVESSWKEFKYYHNLYNIPKLKKMWLKEPDSESYISAEKLEKLSVNILPNRGPCGHILSISSTGETNKCLLCSSLVLPAELKLKLELLSAPKLEQKTERITNSYLRRYAEKCKISFYIFMLHSLKSDINLFGKFTHRYRRKDKGPIKEEDINEVFVYLKGLMTDPDKKAHKSFPFSLSNLQKFAKHIIYDPARHWQELIKKTFRKTGEC